MWKEAWSHFLATATSKQLQNSWPFLKAFLSIYSALPSHFRLAVEHVFADVLARLPLEGEETSLELDILKRSLHFFLLECGSHNYEKKHHDTKHWQGFTEESTSSPFVKPFRILLRHLSGAPLPSASRTSLLRYMAQLLSILASNFIYSTTLEPAVMDRLSSPAPSSSSSSASSAVRSLHSSISTMFPGSPLPTLPSPSIGASPLMLSISRPSPASNDSFASLGVFTAAPSLGEVFKM